MAKDSPKLFVPPLPSLIGDREIYIIGFVKMGPAKYSVVQGTARNPIFDTSKGGVLIAEPLEFACEAAKLALQALLRNLT